MATRMLIGVNRELGLHLGYLVLTDGRPTTYVRIYNDIFGPGGYTATMSLEG